MGCTKCRQEQILKENKVNEIVYNKNTGRNLKTSSIIDNLHNIVDYNNVYTKKEILEEIELNQLEKTIQKLKTNKKLLNLLKKCQSRIIGMQYRKRVRFDNLRRSETLTLNNLLKKNIPISKEQIENFFMEYPAKISDSHIKIIKSDPIIFPNKIIYIGEWDTIFFQKYGRGIQIYPDNSFYKGYWENNKAHGKGEFLHSSGDKYIGYWKDNKRDGKGTYKSKDGMEYEGYWKNDKPNGEGKEMSGGNLYIGSYLNGKKNGNGILQMKNGDKYDGTFENGLMNGRGVYTFSDKRIYEGEFVNNTFEGKGEYTWPNGNKYKGYFKNNKREGFGIFYFNNGKIYRGIWSEGKLDGEFDIYYPERNIWSKKKAKIKEEEKNNKNYNDYISKKDGEFDLDEFNQGHILDISELSNLDEIKKNEEVKIEFSEVDL